MRDSALSALTKSGRRALFRNMMIAPGIFGTPMLFGIVTNEMLNGQVIREAPLA